MDRLLSIKEAAALLSVSRATMYRLIEQNKISACRILNRTQRIRQSDIDKFIEESFSASRANDAGFAPS